MGYTLFSFFLSGFVSGFNYNTHKDRDTLIQNKKKCNNPENLIIKVDLLISLFVKKKIELQHNSYTPKLINL